MNNEELKAADEAATLQRILEDQAALVEALLDVIGGYTKTIPMTSIVGCVEFAKLECLRQNKYFLSTFPDGPEDRK